jgi:hypothetical protein
MRKGLHLFAKLFEDTSEEVYTDVPDIRIYKLLDY